MVKKILAAALFLLLVAAAGVFLLARAVFTHENVRTAIEQQLSSALGQPVKVGAVDVGIFPRVTLSLEQVSVGVPPRMTARNVDFGTNLRALFSRRIEGADVRLAGARIELPMAVVPIPVARPGDTAGSRSLPVEIVSIDEIVLSDVELVSGGRTLRSDIELVPHRQGITIRSATFRADGLEAAVAGEIKDLSGPVGELTLKTRELNLDAVVAFAAEFARGAGFAARGSPTGAAMNIAMTLDADKATLGSAPLTNLSGRARITGDAVRFEPIGFGLFGGKYEGELTFALGQANRFHLKAAVSSINMTDAMAFAGHPDTITGRLSGTSNLTGRWSDPGSAVKSASGSARIDIVDGIVRHLGLVRTIVIAGSGRSEPQGATEQAPGGSQPQGSRDEPFSRLGATLAIAGGMATTNDLRLESRDLLLSAAGTIALDGTSLNLAGTAQLSDELAQRAGRDLVRYTQVDGRPTLPVRIGGSLEDPRVSIEIGDAIRRAIINKAKEEIGSAIRKGIGKLFEK